MGNRPCCGGKTRLRDTQAQQTASGRSITSRQNLPIVPLLANCPPCTLGSALDSGAWDFPIYLEFSCDTEIGCFNSIAASGECANSREYAVANFVLNELVYTCNIYESRTRRVRDVLNPFNPGESIIIGEYLDGSEWYSAVTARNIPILLSGCRLRRLDDCTWYLDMPGGDGCGCEGCEECMANCDDLVNTLNALNLTVGVMSDRLECLSQFIKQSQVERDYVARHMQYQEIALHKIGEKISQAIIATGQATAEETLPQWGPYTGLVSDTNTNFPLVCDLNPPAPTPE